MPEQLFVFMQLEFPWILGPPDGRYLLRERPGSEPQHVVVLRTLGAGRAIAADGTRRRPRRLRRARPRPARHPASPEPAAVETTRVTVVDPVPLAAEHQASAWVSEMDWEQEARRATAVVNRVLNSHRIAAADPHVHEVSPAQAIVIRAGWGEGEQVAEGRWLHARELEMPHELPAAGGGSRRHGRSSALRPVERLAALLGGRSVSLMCEELALRARADLDQGRAAHAAVELDRAYAAAIGELRSERRQDLALRVSELEQLGTRVAEQARVALGDGVAEDPQSAATVDEELLEHALGRLEAALRARTAGSRLQ
jgi:hypothetical protein